MKKKERSDKTDKSRLTVDEITQYVRSYIAQKRLKGGDKIEPQLVAEYIAAARPNILKVTPRAVQTAFQILNNEGLLRIRSKFRTEVRSASLDETITLMALRAAIESFVGCALSQMPDKIERLTEVAKYHESLKQLEQNSTGVVDGDQYRQIDACFHRELFTQAEYAVGIELLDWCRQRLGNAMAKNFRSRSGLCAVIDEHQGIIDAIQNTPHQSTSNSSSATKSIEQQQLEHLAQKAAIEHAFAKHLKNSAMRSLSAKMPTPDVPTND